MWGRGRVATGGGPGAVRTSRWTSLSASAGRCRPRRTAQTPDQLLRSCYPWGMRTISQREMRNDSGRVLRDVEAGQTFVVTRRGSPVARIVPLSEGPLAHRSARRPPRFSVADLVPIDTPTADLLDELRAER